MGNVERWQSANYRWSPVPIADRVAAPFCDYVRVTVPAPYDDDAMDELRPFLDCLGCGQVAEGLYQRVGRPGVLRRQKRQGLSSFAVSGNLLTDLRAVGLYDQFLSVFAAVPHRVTLIDAACDFLIPAPSRVCALYAEARTGTFRLTRKVVPAHAVRAVLNSDIEGNETGTVYLGRRGAADVYARVYDKRHERICRGAADPGPLLRVEMTGTGGVGITLKDASDPERFFYHYAAPDLCEAPSGVGEWVPNAEGFVMQKRPEFTPYQRLARIVSDSPDLGRVADLLGQLEGGIAAGMVLLRSMLERRKSMRDAAQKFSKGGAP